MSTRVAVMGSGSWGTAFALVLSDAGQQVSMWARRPEVADAITHGHRNPDYFPDIELPDSVVAVTDPHAAMDGAAPDGRTALTPAFAISVAPALSLSVRSPQNIVYRDVLGVPEALVAQAGTIEQIGQA